MKIDPEGLKITIQDFVKNTSGEFLKNINTDRDSYTKVAQELIGKAMQIVKQFGGKAPSGAANGSTINPAGSPRAMKFPYTFTAKIIQFPWVFYVKNNWVYRYYVIAIFVTLPVFKKISDVFNSPANVKKWEEIRRKEREEMIEHGH